MKGNDFCFIIYNYIMIIIMIIYFREYYQNNDQCLAACKISFHYLLHVADSIKYCGLVGPIGNFPWRECVAYYNHSLNRRSSLIAILQTCLLCYSNFICYHFFLFLKLFSKKNQQNNGVRNESLVLKGMKKNFTHHLYNILYQFKNTNIWLSFMRDQEI